VELTSHAFVAMTTTWAEDADEAEVLPAPADPVPPDPPVPPVDPVVGREVEPPVPVPRPVE